MSDKVIHDIEESRFYIELGGGEAEITYFITEDKAIDLEYTFVPEDHRNQGYADKLVKAALDWAEKEKKSVIASCPVVDMFVKRHTEYKHLLSE